MSPAMQQLLNLLIDPADTHAVRKKLTAMINAGLPLQDAFTQQVVDRLVDLHCVLRAQHKEERNVE